MSRDVRAVLDTNVLISAALLAQSPARMVVDWLLTDGQLLQSAETLSEFEEVLWRPKFNKYVDESDRRAFLYILRHAADLTLCNVKISECRDPKDDKFLELAISGDATHIVSGDQDLLVLNPFRGIPIMRPADFLKLVQES